MNQKRSLPASCVALAALLLVGSGAEAVRADVKPSAGMMRQPDVSRTHIVFSYANDLWVVPRTGGVAVPLASPDGIEQFPRFSPDGQQIAFVGNYDGNSDLYVVPFGGGVPTRVTYHGANETLCDWSADNRLVFFTNAYAPLRRLVQLFTIAPTGGLAAKLPVPYGANAAISADGEWLAYTPNTRDNRTWKRYRGGMATDIWLFNLKTSASRKITDWEGTDTQPMWHNGKLYYLSDAGDEHRLNVWTVERDGSNRRQVTRFADYDVKWPAIGPASDGSGEIVLENAGKLYRLTLKDEELHEVSITIPGDRPTVRPQTIDVRRSMRAFDISATGKRVVAEARGDIWTLPAVNGTPRNLTRTDGVAERDPAWSPDGRWIAYFSDETGEYELYVMQSDGKDTPRKLTKNSKTYYFMNGWSPDSKYVSYADKAGNLYICSLDDGKVRLVDRNPWGNPVPMSWSHDSRWLAYAIGGDNVQGAVWLYHLPTSEKHQVTAGMFDDGLPTFDRKGDFLYFTSRRAWRAPRYEDVGTTFVYADTQVLLAVPLRDDVKSPWLPKSDEESWEDEADDESDESTDADKQDADDGKDAEGDDEADDDEDESDEDEVTPLEIALDGFERRAIPLPVDNGSFGGITVTHDGKLIYFRGSRLDRSKRTIQYFDPEDEEKKEKTVLDGSGFFVLSGDGKKLLVGKDGKYAIVDAKPDQKLKKTIPTDGMQTTVDPRKEWAQMLRETWRLQRDLFYDPNMHGVDWSAMYDHYARLLDDCYSKDDLSVLIGELISEINVGHAYYRTGPSESGPRMSVGTLGCDFAFDNGAYRIATIHEGAPWDSDARGPLSQPGIDVHEGDYLLAVNGRPVDPQLSPYAALQGLAGKVVTLTVSERSEHDDDARDVVIRLLSNDTNLRYRGWIEAKRAYVAEKTNGRVGYIYVPDTTQNGQNNLFRQFYGQRDKQALIIDERWNGGGQIPTRFVELLNRPVTNYWARRDGHDWVWPPDAHRGPKCMLINGLSGSGGDAFPYYFRQAGLGKLVGMRTWGGLVGITGNPPLLDGTGITVPAFAFYENDGTWGVEGHGVDPDIEVLDDPAKMVDGGDPQLDAAIQLMLDELRDKPYQAPQRPRYPDRKGMKIPQRDY